MRATCTYRAGLLILTLAVPAPSSVFSNESLSLNWHPVATDAAEAPSSVEYMTIWMWLDGMFSYINSCMRMERSASLIATMSTWGGAQLHTVASTHIGRQPCSRETSLCPHVHASLAY